MWQFWIDVGGTFTDCIGRDPHGRLHTCKVLSSGIAKGSGAIALDGRPAVVDPARCCDPHGFWIGSRIHLLGPDELSGWTTSVSAFDAAAGKLLLADRPPDRWLGRPVSYELITGEEAPILAIRTLLRLPTGSPLPPLEVRLGTTRGTNALLERKGARTAFMTTRGFADVLLIANQDRPRLFDLAIRKPPPLFDRVLEIDERLAADGSILKAPDVEKLRGQLHDLRASGIDSLAICLLHAFVNPAHEELVARVAREAGFAEVSVSSEVAPLIKIVSRGDTTLMDAYLTPVLREYVAAIRAALSGSAAVKGQTGAGALKVMTSAGGLVNAGSFSGKDSILSGPAGGVIGFSRVAEQAGFPRAIGFDMGGTSTDVSRYDGRYEFEYETTKAGVRIVAPMLAIETVAAGGGSVCGFDGVQLSVGPASAGASPGPACYGRGGPLTVTDVNLVLGKLLPSEFPFPLDAAAPLAHLRELCEEIASSPLARRYDPLELAEGFVAIANSNMTRAIRRISVAKGYDPAEYALVVFGGAGGQHACAIADALGMKAVLIHPLAGILSAYGIGVAEVARHAEQAVLRPLTHVTGAELDEIFLQLEAPLREEIRSEGIPESRIERGRRSLDLRYIGVESTINIPQPDDGAYASRYEEAHEQLFGYRHHGREFEIVAARVEVIGRTNDSQTPIETLVPRRPSPCTVTKVQFSGAVFAAGVYRREQLHPGDKLSGPAILLEPTSTLVIDPGWNATVGGRGEIVLRPDSERSCAAPRTLDHSAPDPVTLELFNSQFASIAEQMGVTLQRTAISTNVKERLDFSCAVFDPVGNLVVNAPHIPVHLGAMSETVKGVLADNRPAEDGSGGIRPGDVFITNDPYRGGSHLPDVTVVTPVHDPQTGELVFLTASRAHHAEIGGVVPGSMPPFSTNLAQEGVLIRNFKLVDAGRAREDQLRRLLTEATYPTRRIEDNLADVAAQVAANRAGVRLLNELVERRSLPVVQAYMGHIQRAAAEKMRLALSRLGDGVYERTDHLDDGSPIVVRIAIENGSAVVDFTGTGPVLPSNLNANRAIVTAAVMYVFRCLIDEDIPLNSGVLAPVEIVLPECLLNPPAAADPENCPAIVGGNVETSQRVVDVLLGALGLAAASQGTMNNLTFGDSTFGYYETICGGGGAAPDADGADAVHTHMTNTRLTDVEVLERRYPVRVREFSIRRGSGGAGRRRGGDGIVRRIEFLRPLKVSMLSQRRGDFAPFGLNGGDPGAIGRNLLLRAGSEGEEDLGGSFQIDVSPGDVLIIETPGGGGFGPAAR
jgi:5-oxoprolinase (ATP-hydrolysing)